MALPTAEDLLLLHNPDCSKSRALKAALDERGADYATRLYLEDPLTDEELTELVARFGGEAHDLVRTGEPEYAQAGLHVRARREAILDAIACYPALLQRPILLRGERAAIGRPLESALELL